MNVRDKVLIVEDDEGIRKFLSTTLIANGYSVILADDGKSALELVSSHCPVCILLDLGLPDIDGNEIIRSIRSWTSIPILVISARTTEDDKACALDLGADDYLTKPFDLDELHARVAVQLRHASRGAGRSTNVLRFKDWTLDVEARTLTAAGQPVRLTRLEFGIIEALVRRPKKVFTKRELFEAAWHEECFVEEKAVTVHMSNIRSKLKPSGTDAYLETVWGIGFKLAE